MDGFSIDAVIVIDDISRVITTIVQQGYLKRGGNRSPAGSGSLPHALGEHGRKLLVHVPF